MLIQKINLAVKLLELKIFQLKNMHGLDNEKQIFFYEHEFYIFSNFSSFKVMWDGVYWMTSEHAYQASKFDDVDIRKKIEDAPSAHEAMHIARNHRDKYKDNWDGIKLEVMKGILKAKVKQHPYVKKKLLESGNKELIENSWRDDYWGWGANKDGQNYLGKLWMEVREEFVKSN